MRLANSVSVLHDCWVIPVTFVLCLYFLYQQIGFACFGAIFVMLLLSPANYLVMKIYLKYSRQTMERRDKRVKLLTEILEGIKIVKYFGWEHKMQARIQVRRRGPTPVDRPPGAVGTRFRFCFRSLCYCPP